MGQLLQGVTQRDTRSLDYSSYVGCSGCINVYIYTHVW